MWLQILHKLIETSSKLNCTYSVILFNVVSDETQYSGKITTTLSRICLFLHTFTSTYHFHSFFRTDSIPTFAVDFPRTNRIPYGIPEFSKDVMYLPTTSPQLRETGLIIQFPNIIIHIHLLSSICIYLYLCE